MLALQSSSAYGWRQHPHYQPSSNAHSAKCPQEMCLFFQKSSVYFLSYLNENYFLCPALFLLLLFFLYPECVLMSNTNAIILKNEIMKIGLSHWGKLYIESCPRVVVSVSFVFYFSNKILVNNGITVVIFTATRSHNNDFVFPCCLSMDTCNCKTDMPWPLTVIPHSKVIIWLADCTKER